MVPFKIKILAKRVIYRFSRLDKIFIAHKHFNFLDDPTANVKFPATNSH